jgi:peptidyl-prolyl cis-trans isomerase SurA
LATKLNDKNIDKQNPMKKILYLNLVLLFTLGLQTTKAQDTLGTMIDEVVAVVGQHYVLHSDIENQYLQLRMQGSIDGSEPTVKCRVMENLLFEKLMLHQADIDSVEVTQEQVTQELDRRMRYFISQFGSQEKLEKFYDKSVIEFKAELSEVIEEQLKIQEVQRTITENTKVTPSDVKKFFKTMPKDSIPLISSIVQVAEIVKKPPISYQERFEVQERLRKLKERVDNGESFEALAVLYSEDPGSAKQGGDIGLHGRGELYPEFEVVAFKLEPGEISEIVETEAGFHVIQGIERRGEFMRVRHILVRPKVSPLELAEARVFLDSVANLIRNDSITFEEAVVKFSTDPDKNSKGLLINPYSGSTDWLVDELDPKVFFVIDKLAVGEVSTPVLMEDDKGEEAYRLLTLKKRTEPHRANLDDDYDAIQNWALQFKKQEVIKVWIEYNASKTYIKVNDDYKDCDFEQDWY